MGAASVTVVIPTYNGRKFIGAAVRSVFRQAMRPSELIVVDDASADGTAAVVRSLAADAPVPLRLIELTHNSGGPTRPLNVGIAAARGELIAVLDQDDEYLPEWIARMTAGLEAHPDASYVACTCGRIDHPQGIAATGLAVRSLRTLLQAAQKDQPCLLLNGRETARRLLGFGNFLVGYPGFLFRRCDWQQKGGLDEGLKISSDYDLLCWLSLRGPVVFLPQRLYLRRVHRSNLSGSGVRPWVELALLVLRHLDEACAGEVPAEFWDQLRQHVLRMLVGLGWADRHREALQLLWAGNRAWGLNPQTPSVLTRLAYTWTWCRLHGPLPNSNPAEGDELLSLLRRLQRCCAAPARERADSRERSPALVGRITPQTNSR
jgi:glycosyltransferase involved in cell wall biosynthesis